MADSERSENLPLAFEGELGIGQAEEVHQALLAALSRDGELEVDLSRAGAVGLCFLQLLCAAHKSAAKQGKKLLIRPGASVEFRQALARAGFARQRGCADWEDAGCIWNMEDQS